MNPAGILDAEWSDPQSARDSLAVCYARGGHVEVRMPRRDDGDWLELEVVIPMTDEPLWVRQSGTLESFTAARCKDIRIVLSNKISGHGYNVRPERAKEFSAFLDRNPDRANKPETEYSASIVATARADERKACALYAGALVRTQPGIGADAITDAILMRGDGLPT